MQVHSLDTLLFQISSQDPNQDPVLSVYLNQDAEGKNFFEQQVARVGLSPDIVRVARRMVKQNGDAYKASAVFVRGGQRMFVYHVPLAVPVENRLTVSTIPSIYTLCEIRDNLDRFNLLHLSKDAAWMSHFELGKVESELFCRTSKSSTIAECMQRFPKAKWLIAAPEERSGEFKGLIFSVNPAASWQQVQSIALQQFRDAEELHSRRWAKALLHRKEKVSLGQEAVLSALEAKRALSLVLHSGTHSIQERAAWLAKRAKLHVEVVDQLDELSAVGGAACRLATS